MRWVNSKQCCPLFYQAIALLLNNERIMFEVLPAIDTTNPTLAERERLQKQRRPILNTLSLDVKGGRSLD